MPTRASVRKSPRRGVLLLAGLALAACGPAGERPRNVLLISLDTVRPDHLSCYGRGRETSPAIDALAARGVRFTDVTAAAPWTLPSHASMLTGLYPSRHGVKNHQTCLPDGVVTLAEELAGAGFDTLAVVNTHNLGAPQYRLDQGFRHFRYVTETQEDKDFVLRVPNMGGVVAAEARAALAKRDASKPYFLFLHFYDAHTDFTPSAEHRSALVSDYDGELEGGTQELNRIRNKGERLSDDDLRFLRELYDAEIRTLDDVVGGFLAWLDGEGLLEDTLVVLTSDHGEEFQEHGGLLHGRTQYQELLRVPLIVAGPGVPRGAVVDAPAHGVDVAPTVLALLGVESRAARDGLDLSPTWRGERLPERALFGEADQDNRFPERTEDTRQMVRRGSEKLIADRMGPRFELYDLASDPLEQRDLVAERGERARELALELKGFLERAVVPQRIRPPSEEERRKLEAMGYGGGGADGAQR